MGILGKKVRKRWTRDHTHDLWVGDFEEGPYVLEEDKVVPTHLSAFIDCHSRYAVSARYYFRQNMDVLIDTLVRALSVHGAPLEIYLDNAKVYHSQGLRAACYKMNTRLIYRTKGDPSPGGVIERFIQTAQDQFEAEVRAGDILSLSQLNRSFAAWLAIAYHQEVHSETHQSPEARYQTGLRVIRQVDMKEIISSFMQSVTRRVNPTFADVQLNKRLYKVEPKLRGDKVEVHFDPFSSIDTVEIYSLRGEYLGTGMLHNRESGQPAPSSQTTGKPKYNYLELLIGQHQRKLEEETKGIDYRKVVTDRAWPFHEFANTLARLLGMKGGLTAFTAMELETLKKVYNQSTSINSDLVKTAVAKAYQKSIPHIVHELKNLLKEIDSCF
jgi:hypothetical protein